MEPAMILAKFVGEGTEKIFEISGNVDSGKTGTVVIKSGGSETEEDLMIGGGGGGGVEYPLREITITNNTASIVNLWGDIQISNDVAENKVVAIGVGKTVVVKVVAPRLISSGYQKQALVLSLSADVNEPTITGDHITVLGHILHSETSGVVTTTTRYTTIRIDAKSTKDIAITIS